MKTLTVIPSKSPSTQADLVALGERATHHYTDAIGGMRSLLCFYAAVKVLQAEAEGFDSTAENQMPRTRGNVSKPTDLKAVFARYMPKVNIKTAYKLMGVGANIALEYEARMTKRIAEQWPLPALVIAAPETLPAAIAKKREEFFEFVDGTSKQSWLDKFRPAPSLGGARVKDPDKTYDPNAPIENARDLLLHPLRTVAKRWSEKEAKLPLWSHLPPAELREIDNILLDLRNDLKAALKKGE